MSAEIINLRQVRKARARAEKERVAEENRARFGQSKAEREGNRSQNALAEGRLDGARRETPDGEGGGDPGPASP